MQSCTSHFEVYPDFGKTKFPHVLELKIPEHNGRKKFKFTSPSWGLLKNMFTLLKDMCFCNHDEDLEVL